MADEQALRTLLERVNRGDDEAMSRLMEQVYGELQQMAERRLRGAFGANMAGATLEPSALVNETFLRLIKQRSRYDNRGHFFAIATRLMFRTLMDYHRSRHADKRGGGYEQVTLSGIVADAVAADVPSVVAAFDKLEGEDPRAATVAKLHVLWGLTLEEAAQSLDLSHSTVKREWRYAKGWLIAELGLS